MRLQFLAVGKGFLVRFGVGLVPVLEGLFQFGTTVTLSNVPLFTAFGFQSAHEIGGEQAIGFGEAEAIFAIPAFPLLGQSERAAG